MKTALTLTLVLVTSPAFAVPQTPIAFETLVSLDKFRVTNAAESAHIFQVEIRPSGTFTTTLSHEEMHATEQPPWPGDDFTGWLLSRFPPGRWMEINGTPPLGSQLWVEFAEPFTQQRGWVYGFVQNGRFEGWTIPEPASVVLALIGVVALVAWRRKR